MFDEKQKLMQIIDLGQEITEVQDVDLLLERILTVARRFVNADAGSIYVKEEGWLKFSYTQNETMQKKLPPGKKLIYSTFSIPVNNESIAGYVASTGEMLNIPDVYELPPEVSYSFNKGYDELSNYRTKSVLTLPLKTCRGEIVGVLQLINAKDDSGNILSFAKA
ncbi:MAG TPA: GAF domain-containing protein, partial [Dissulfurispiraceae bacterium]